MSVPFASAIDCRYLRSRFALIDPDQFAHAQVLMDDNNSDWHAEEPSNHTPPVPSGTLDSQAARDSHVLRHEDVERARLVERSPPPSYTSENESHAALRPQSALIDCRVPGMRQRQDVEGGSGRPRTKSRLGLLGFLAWALIVFVGFFMLGPRLDGRWPGGGW